MPRHTVYAIASGKGGVGKTTTAVNLGTSLSAAGHRVVIVDVDLGMANLDSFLGLSPDGRTLHDVLAGKIGIEDAIYDAPGTLDVIPSGAGLAGYADVETGNLSDVVSDLRDRYDFVLLDVGAGVTHDSILPLGLSDAVILVTTPDIAAVRDTIKTREITEHLGGSVLGLVVTRAGHGYDLDPFDVADELSTDLLAVVPEDHAVGESLFERTPVVVYDPESTASAVYRRLTNYVNGGDESLPIGGELVG